MNAGNIVLLQILPKLESGGVERGTIEIVKASVEVGMESIVVSNGGAMAEEVTKAGGLHLAIPVHRKNPLSIAINVFRIAKIISQYKVDIVHARSRAPAWVAYFACKLTGCHFVTTVHGNYSGSFWMKRWYNSVMVKGEKIIAVSEFVKHYALERFCFRKHTRLLLGNKIQVIHRGADLNNFNQGILNQGRIMQVSNFLNLPTDHDIVLLPGRFTRWKGQETLIRAIKYISHRQNLIFLLLGNLQEHPSYVKELLKLAKQEQVEESVVFRNSLKDMPSAYMISSIVLSTSTQPEAFGRVAVEACAMGKPIIATAIGGSTETILDGETGFLVQPANPKQLAEKIDEILDMDSSKLNLICKKAMLHIRQHFSIDKMCNETLKVYLDILNSDNKETITNE